ncbi:MAG: rRNA pseudouridine synthase [Defluviitaleaceae bacterium]|nr:rRNA pseudouridine synthase [Defluviitaleaceae bacterium]
MRLQKYLAEAGIASRRKAEELILAGQVTINGKTAQIGGSYIDGDVVLVSGNPVEAAEKLVYIVLNKPAGIISSAKDQFGRQTVLDIVGNLGVRLYPVGRLDYHSAGLVLLTNDGDLAQKMTHPRHGMEKCYIARVKLPIKPEDASAFHVGLTIDGYKTRPAHLEIIDKWGKQAKITLFEGRNRQIRKMFAALENEVVSLKRISMGEIALGNLKSGAWRHLTPSEVKSLKGGE